MKKPLISLIIPIYNMELYIAKCLDSIIKQKNDNIEVICINDGSTDDSANICEKYQKKDERIILINKENGGVSSARNIGLTYAKGKYIAWCDPDDYLSDDWYESIAPSLQDEKDVILIGCNLVKFPPYRFPRYRKRSGNIDKENFIYDFCLGYKIQSYLWSMITKRDLWNNIQFPEELSLWEDLSTLYMVVEKGERFYYIDKKIYNYVNHNKNMTDIEDKSIEERLVYKKQRIDIDYKRYQFFKDKGYTVSPMCYLKSCYWYVRAYFTLDKNERYKYIITYNDCLKEIKEHKDALLNHRYSSWKTKAGVIFTLCYLSMKGDV